MGVRGETGLVRTLVGVMAREAETTSELARLRAIQQVPDNLQVRSIIQMFFGADRAAVRETSP